MARDLSLATQAIINTHVAAAAVLAAVAALLVWQNRSAERVELAFFHINSWLGFVVLAMVWLGIR